CSAPACGAIRRCARAPPSCAPSSDTRCLTWLPRPGPCAPPCRPPWAERPGARRSLSACRLHLTCLGIGRMGGPVLSPSPRPWSSLARARRAPLGGLLAPTAVLLVISACSREQRPSIELTTGGATVRFETQTAI